MGNSGSRSPSSPSASNDSRRVRASRAAALARTGRYARLVAGSGATVHVLGVYPCSPVSEEEAFDLVEAVQPDALYVDVHPEIAEALVDDVKAGRVGAAFAPPVVPASDGSTALTTTRALPAVGYVVSEAYPTLSQYKTPHASWLATVFHVRPRMINNEMCALMGAEAYGAYKAGIAATRPLDASKSVKLLTYPFPLSYNNYSLTDRPSHISAETMGNAGPSSDALLLAIGKPLATKNDVEAEARIPPSGYFTRAQLTKLQDDFRRRVSAVTSSTSATSADVEAVLAERELQTREAGDAATAAAIASSAMLSQHQSQAIAYHLQEVAAKLPPTGNVVALVNLGGHASLARNWDNAAPPAVLLPPLNPYLLYASTGFQTLLGGGLLYGVARLGRRFPVSVSVTATLAAGAVGLFGYGVAHPETMMYGGVLRDAMTRPRVTSPVMRLDK